MENVQVLNAKGAFFADNILQKKLGVSALKDNLHAWSQGIKYDESKALESQDDGVLIYLYNKGSNSAFEILYRRHKNNLYNFICRIVNDPGMAEDIFQEVFIRIINSSSKFKMKSKFTTWAYTIARNLCIDHIRKRKRTDAKNIVEKDTEFGNRNPIVERLPDKDLSPEDITSSLEIRVYINEALERLNPDQKEVFIMREEFGLSFDEISKICNCSIGTIKSRMRYALENIRRYLKTKNITG